MAYQKKLTLLLVAVSVFSCGMSAGLSYYKIRSLLLDQIRSKALSIATTAAALLDGNAHNEIRTRTDESSLPYREFALTLRKVRDANRRPDVFIKNVYTLRNSQLSPRIVEFVVDAEEKAEDFSHVGDIYKGSTEDPTNLRDPQVDKVFTHDQWGDWLSATVPIKDNSGRPVGALGLDAQAADVRAKLQELLVTNLAAVALASGIAALISWQASKRVCRPLQELRRAAEEFRTGKFDRKVQVETKDEFGELARSMNDMAAGIKERETIKAAFARYVSQEVLEKILSSGSTSALKGERRRITVLFSDIRGFTAMAETMAPEEVVSFLDDYFERMIEIIFRNHGTLDKFLGDGLMAIFGAPADDQFQEEHAARAAIEMQTELQNLSGRLEQEGQPPIRIGIGINSGSAVVGNVGSAMRMEYTAIGDTVNVAARLETLTRELSADILASESTYDSVRHLVGAREMGPVSIKGRLHPVMCYAIDSLRK